MTTINKKETEKLINATVAKTVDELLRQNLIKKSNRNTYQKTEQLLYNYNNFKEVVKDKQEMIAQIKTFGLSKTSASILPMPSDAGFKYIPSEQEKIDAAIIELESSIAVTTNFIKIIDNALKTIEDDPYFNVIKMCYFENKKHSVVANDWVTPIDETTIGRNKNRLVKKLSIYLFSDDVIKELYE
ncbi:MAG: hypothetical protein HFF36_02850 [Coprobacillus sp.]|nr:hypothetical protein [Coprobacillus sp.]